MKKFKLENISIAPTLEKEIPILLAFEKQQNISIISKKSILEDLQDLHKIYLTLKLKRKIVGYIAFSYVEDTMDILAISIAKDFQRKGLASFLLTNTISFAKKNDIIKILLEVRKTNIAAQSLYENLGFKKIFTREKYYPNNFEDAYIYKLDIT